MVIVYVPIHIPISQNINYEMLTGRAFTEVYDNDTVLVSFYFVKPYHDSILLFLTDN